MLLRKGVYSYIYMDEWEKLNETSLPGNLNMEDITNSDYMHAKRLWKLWKLPLSDAFENFREMCQKIYGLDPAKFLEAPGLAWQAALKKLK